MPLRYPRRAGLLLSTGQTVCYHVGDDGDYETGLKQRYEILTASQYSGTTNIDTPHYAAATLAFVSATKKITDSANGLATVLTGDTIRVRGSTGNDGVYTVATGGVAGEIVTTEALADESAGAMVTICKRSAPSNNAVVDLVTGRMYKRYATGTTGAVEKVGAASAGSLAQYDAAACFTIHAAADDLQMTTTGLKIVGGAAELPAYFAGMVIVCSGFANGVNNLPGYRITSVAVNGDDLDITLWTGNNTLIAEAAAGSRAIKVVCRSVYAYCAAANIASFAGYTDWRVPTPTELMALCIFDGTDALPDATAFPNWSSAAPTWYWTSTSQPNITTYAEAIRLDYGSHAYVDKTTVYYCELVRGG